jgi:DNA gyrase subunit B
MEGMTMGIESADVIEHFRARAGTYDRSSSWCTDEALGEVVLDLAGAGPNDRVLDVACGTGLVSRLFHGTVAHVVGLDITESMAEQALPYLDELVIAPGEKLPFDDDSFDVVTCRQGIQFMELPRAVEEMVRVLRPGGRIVLINLCAYSADDEVEYFEILRLRNPVRKHFFARTALSELLTAGGCDDVVLREYVSVEDVDAWSDSGAIEEPRREAIRDVYRGASAQFRQLHAVEMAEGRIVDHMLFVIASGTKPERRSAPPGPSGTPAAEQRADERTPR